MTLAVLLVKVNTFISHMNLTLVDSPIAKYLNWELILFRTPLLQQSIRLSRLTLAIKKSCDTFVWSFESHKPHRQILNTSSPYDAKALFWFVSVGDVISHTSKLVAHLRIFWVDLCAVENGMTDVFWQLFARKSNTH